MKNFLLLFIPLLALSCHRQAPAGNELWIRLFNHENLDDWQVKFNHYDLGVNLNNTFRVEDGLLTVDYDGWDSIDDEFGHLFYKTPFSSYILRVEYRFFGEQVPGGPSWAFRNNGVMLFCQSPETMGKDQAFPVSVEGQLLGGEGDRTTGNVCTPGTNIYIGDSLVEEHCTPSTSETYPGDQWVTIEFHVYGDKAVYHIIDGDTVMAWSRPEIGGGMLPEGYPLTPGTILTGGYIALQAESAPTQFRKVELLELTEGDR